MIRPLWQELYDDMLTQLEVFGLEDLFQKPYQAGIDVAVKSANFDIW